MTNCIILSLPWSLGHYTLFGTGGLRLEAYKIHGHCWESIGILIGNPLVKLLCVPFIVRIATGLGDLSSFPGNTAPAYSMAVQPYFCVFRAAKLVYELTGRSSIILLDRYFLCVPALKLLQTLHENEAVTILDVVTKVKRGYVAYLDPPPHEKGKRGAPRKKGASFDLFSIFDNPTITWMTVNVKMYGKSETVECYVGDFLWGKGLYQKMRFVFIRNFKDFPCTVLVSTNLTLTAEQIIELYTNRQKIEGFFREFKQIMGGFAYHFWTKVLEKYNHYSKKGDKSPMETVTGEDNKEKVVRNVKRMEGFVMFAAIAMGIAQIRTPISNGGLNVPLRGISRRPLKRLSQS